MTLAEELFERNKLVELSFFNFKNAISACYFADRDLRILQVNENFKDFFPVLGNVSNAYFLDVLEQLGVDSEQISSFAAQLKRDGQVLIPHIPLTINGEDRVFSLMSTYTTDANFSYLNGVQGQFVDRTAESALREERERLLEDRLRDREVIEEKTRQLERVADRLAKYLSPQIYNSIFSGANDDLAAPLSRKNLTVFFSDIEGFTEITDRMEPERLSFFINTYLSEMANIAIEYGGTIDKFIGDAILVFFGDPESEGAKTDALQCARMAVRMRERVLELEDVWRENGIPESLRVRMGISTGYCTVGNFGSEHRLDYTVLGSPVNLAARLQTAAEAGTILLSETTCMLIENAVHCTRVDELDLKGFAQPVGCYRLEGLRDDDDHAPLTRSGRHVTVNIADRGNIREAMEELRRIGEELTQQVPRADAP